MLFEDFGGTHLDLCISLGIAALIACRTDSLIRVQPGKIAVVGIGGHIGHQKSRGWLDDNSRRGR
jgi:hypothetical protein